MNCGLDSRYVTIDSRDEGIKAWREHYMFEDFCSRCEKIVFRCSGWDENGSKYRACLGD